jgi:hypothetical protein
VSAAKKSVILILAFILLSYVIGPLPRTFAEAHITRFTLQDAKYYYVNYSLIAGYEHTPYFESDGAGSTSVERIRYEYSPDNGVSWLPLDIFRSTDGKEQLKFVLPVDPHLISAKFRVSAYFEPILGSNSYSEKIIGPYKILQPGSPSDVFATANKDISVTLSWTDNSNMESNYQITRDGPDGAKTFNVPNTMDNIGPLTYVDKTTNPSTIYVYTISTIIDSYDLKEDSKPGVVSAITKTKAQIQVKDKITEIPSIPQYSETENLK